MARNKDVEGPIQQSVFDGLQCQYPKALIFSVPNELASKAGGGKDGKARQHMIRNIQAKAKKMGLLPGMADLCMLLEGLFFAFEVKAKRNYQQPNQKDAQAVIEANGGYYFVVRSVDEAIAAVRSVQLVTAIDHRGSIT